MKSNKIATVMVDGVLRNIGDTLSDGSIVIKRTMVLDIRLLWEALKKNDDTAYINLRKFCKARYIRDVYTANVDAITCLKKGGLIVYRCKFHLIGKEVDAKIGSVYLSEIKDGVSTISDKKLSNSNSRLTPAMAP